MNKGTLFLATIALFAGLTTGFLARAALRSAPAPASSGGDDHNHASMQEPKSASPQKSSGKAMSVSAHGRIVDIRNKTCPVMGGEVDDESFFIIYNGLLVRFCCPGCDGEFLERPLELLKELKDLGASIPMAALASAGNPVVIDAGNSSCPVTGNDVGDSEIYVVHRGVKVRLCSEDCRTAFFDKADEMLTRAAGSGSIPADRLKEEGQ